MTLGSLLISHPVTGATYDYKGGGSTSAPTTANWGVAGSWQGGAIPESSLDNQFTFGGSGSASYTATNNIAGTVFELNAITFNSSSSGTVTVAGTPILRFLNDSSTTGPTITQNGSGAATVTSVLRLANNLTVNLNGTGLLTLGGAIGQGASNVPDGLSPGGITVNGIGSLTLSGRNYFEGAVTMNGSGVLSISDNNAYNGLNVNSGTVIASVKSMAAGTGAITLGGGNLVLRPDGPNVTFSQLGANPVVVAENGTITLDRVSGGNGVVNFTLGTLSIGAKNLSFVKGSGATDPAAAKITFGATTLTGNATLTSGSGTHLNITGAISGSGYSLTTAGAGDATLSGVIGTGSGGLTKNGEGKLTLSGANTYTGATTLNGGILQSTRNAVLSNAASVTVSNEGSTLAVNYGGGSDYNAAQVVTLLGKTTFSSIETNFGFDTTNGAAGGVTYGNNLTMAAGIVKLGSGKLTLTGVNTYTGATTIAGGTLALSGVSTNNIASSSAIHLRDGTVLDVSALTNGEILLANGQNLNATGSTGTVAGMVKFSGDNTLSSVGTLTTGGLSASGLGNVIQGNTISGDLSLSTNAAVAINGALNGKVTGASGAVLSGSGSVSGVTEITNGSINGSGLALNDTTSFHGSGNSLDGSVSGNVAVSSGASLGLSGDLTGSASVAGTATITGSISGSVTVASGGKAGGSGSVGSLVVQNGGEIAPGGVAVTQAVGNVSLAVGSNAAFTLNGKGTPGAVTAGIDYGQVRTGGSLSINGGDPASSNEPGQNTILTISLDGAHPLLVAQDYTATGAGDANTGAENFFVFVLSNAAESVSGQFTALSDGMGNIANFDYSASNQFGGVNGIGVASLNGIEYAISYYGDVLTNSTLGGNDVVLTAIPEPHGWAALVSGATLLAMSRRFRRF